MMGVGAFYLIVSYKVSCGVYVKVMVQNSISWDGRYSTLMVVSLQFAVISADKSFLSLPKLEVSQMRGE